MNKLVKVIALNDEYMQDAEEKFITKRKEYIIIEQSDNDFAIMDDKNDIHWFDYGDTQWFKFIYEKDIVVNNNINIPYLLFFNKDDLGKIVRNAWIEWAKEQPNPKSSWLMPYEELNQSDKDADIRIGQAVVDQCNKCIPEILINYKNK